MKKILFSLMALVCSMSMNAQVIQLKKGNTVVATYTAKQVDNVVFKEASSATTGTAKRTGDIDVKWVQLWEDGPRFAGYNVGASSITDYGGYYCWGSDIIRDSNATYNKGNNALTGTDDTATSLWGSNWRMPTKAELQALLDNCNVAWTTVNGVKGRKFTGKGAYSSSSVFLPAAGYCKKSTTTTRTPTATTGLPRLMSSAAATRTACTSNRAPRVWTTTCAASATPSERCLLNNLKGAYPCPAQG